MNNVIAYGKPSEKILLISGFSYKKTVWINKVTPHHENKQNCNRSKLAGTKRRFCGTDLIDAVSDEYLNPRKRRKSSPIPARNQNETKMKMIQTTTER